MKLTETQKKSITEAFGDNTDNVLEMLSKKKGRCNFFKEDGSLNKTPEEIVSSLEKKPTSKRNESSVSQVKKILRTQSFAELKEVEKYFAELKNTKREQFKAELEAMKSEIDSQLAELD